MGRGIFTYTVCHPKASQISYILLRGLAHFSGKGWPGSLLSNTLKTDMPISELHFLGEQEIIYARKLSNLHEQAFLF